MERCHVGHFREFIVTACCIYRQLNATNDNSNKVNVPKATRAKFISSTKVPRKFKEIPHMIKYFNAFFSENDGLWKRAFLRKKTISIFRKLPYNIVSQYRWWWYQIVPLKLLQGITYCDYRQVSNISHTLVGNKIVDHSDVVGASPVDAAPTTSSFST